MKFDNLLRYTVRILESYAGEIPLQGFLKNFFRENPQMGSRDRKQVSEMAYCYFRLGHTLKSVSAEERILVGLFLTNQKKEPLLEYFRPEWFTLVEEPLGGKISIVNEKFPGFHIEDIFPWKDQLSAGIDHFSFCLSFLKKPRLFIRIRPGHEKGLNAKLINRQIDFLDADPDHSLPFKTFSFQSGTKLDDAFLLNREAVVQDLSSQRTALYLNQGKEKITEAWDCCAGSGGKSILLADLYPGCKLTVSDIRETILNNLQVRFQDAGIETSNLFKADLTDQHDLPHKKFSFIIADLPCTGSGTWSRNPESLYFFNSELLADYSQRQKKILTNILPCLKSGGILVYITCSVFSDENEKITTSIETQAGLKPSQQGLICGYDQGADSMYAVRFNSVK